MVMPITVYCCQLCGSRYDDITHAEKCEASGNLDEPDLNEGDEIEFLDESTMFGSRYCTTTSAGKIIYKTRVFNRQFRQHQTYYVVSLVELNSMEVGVVWNHGDDNPGFVSPAEYKFRPGMADSMRNIESNWRT